MRKGGEMKQKKESSSLPQNTSRREFIKTAAIAAGTAGVLGAGSLSVANAKEQTKTAKGLPITIAGYKVSRVEALADKRVTVKGCNVTFEPAIFCNSRATCSMTCPIQVPSSSFNRLTNPPVD